MIVDPTAAATRRDAQRAREWLAEQRVFISSPMVDTSAGVHGPPEVHVVLR